MWTIALLLIAWEILVRVVWARRGRAASRRLRSLRLCSSPLLSIVLDERTLLFAKARERTSWKKLTRMRPVRPAWNPEPALDLESL